MPLALYLHYEARVTALLHDRGMSAMLKLYQPETGIDSVLFCRWSAVKGSVVSAVDGCLRPVGADACPLRRFSVAPSSTTR